MKHINSQELLTAQEEVALSAEVRNGSKAALDRMCLCNLRLVMNIAKRYRKRGVEFADLFESGVVGLLKACESFNPITHPGVRFASYAYNLVEKEIRDVVYKNSVIRVTNNSVVAREYYKNKSVELSQREGREIGYDETIDLLVSSEIKRDTLKASFRAARETESPKWLCEEFDWGVIDDRMDFRDFWKKSRKLSQQERLVVVHRYGIQGKKPKSMDAIGELLGVSRQWVKTLEKRALLKLAS